MTSLIDISAKQLWKQYIHGDREAKSNVLKLVNANGLSKSNSRIMTRFPKSGRTLKIIRDSLINYVKKNKTVKKNNKPDKMDLSSNKNPIQMKPSSEENLPLDETPKSDIWHISDIDTEAVNILEKSYSKGYIQKVEKLFAETILSTSRDIRTYNRLLNNLYDLLLTDCILSLELGMSPLLQSGGTNEILNNELAFDSTDTQHDFKPGRNKVYPNDIEGAGVKKTPGLSVYDKLNTVIKRVPTYGNEYITSSPIAFEEDIRVDYLLGELVGPLEDIYYYFTDINANPPSWSKERQNFFGIKGDNVKVNSINSLASDVRERLYDGWVLDACVSGRVSSNLGTRKKTLANIWDPVKGTFNTTDLLEWTDVNHFTMMIQSEYSPYKIYDCKINSSVGDASSWPSLYDTVYGSLLNNEFENILTMHLRLAVNNDGKCGVAIFITINGEQPNVFIITSGFPVEKLAQGLRYIDDKYKTKKYTQPIDDNLKSIIDYVDTSLLSSFPDQNQRSAIIQKMLYRFKSSGDHGTSDTVKILNSIGLNYIFLSGDNLAYTYAISSIGTGLPTPTIATYYKVSNKTAEEDEEEEEDEDAMVTNDGEIDGNHFIVAYFPAGDDLKKNYIKLFENLNALYGLAKVLQPDFEPASIEPASIEILYTSLESQNNDLLIYIRQQQSLIFDPEMIASYFKNQVIAQVSYNINNFPFWISFGKLSSVDELMRNLPLELSKIKAIASQLNGFVNKLFFMHKYSDIVRLNMEMIKADRDAFEPIVNLEQTSSSGRAKRSITTRLTGAYTAVKNSLMKNIVSLRGQKPELTPAALKQALSDSFVTERKTEYDRVLGIKKTLSTNSKSLFKRLKEKLGFSEPFVNAMKNEILTINNPLIKQLKDDIATNAGGDDFAITLATLFETDLNNKISATSLEISESPTSVPSLDDLNNSLDKRSNVRTVVSDNLILTKPINVEKKKIITKIKNTASRAVSSISSIFGTRKGGVKSIRRIESRKNKRNAKKLNRLRKTRKNTKRSK